MQSPDLTPYLLEHLALGGETISATPVRVLIVDDSHDDAFLLKSELARRGVHIDYLRVDSAIDMSTALASDNWRLIISDHNMPGFDALGALDVLKRSGRDIPIIIHSGCISNQLAVSAMYEGVSDFVTKGPIKQTSETSHRIFRNTPARKALCQFGSSRI